MVNLGELMMILELHRQGLKVSAIARQLGIDRKTVRRYISRGLEPPTYGPRPPRQRSTDRFLPYASALVHPGVDRLQIEMAGNGAGGRKSLVEQCFERCRELRASQVQSARGLDLRHVSRLDREANGRAPHIVICRRRQLYSMFSICEPAFGRFRSCAFVFTCQCHCGRLARASVLTSICGVMICAHYRARSRTIGSSRGLS